MNKRFNIGDTVVSLNCNTDDSGQPRIRGKIYKVKDVLYCSSCGIQVINLGGDATKNSGMFKCTCEELKHNNGLSWTLSEQFEIAHADSLARSIEEAIDKEDYELGGTLRDSLIEMGGIVNSTSGFLRAMAVLETYCAHRTWQKNNRKPTS